MRKIVFLLSAFAFALLMVSRFSGFVRTGGLAWAQDSSVDDADQNAADKPTTAKFSGKGTLDGTVTTPCSHFECFSFTGMVTKTSDKGLGTGDISGNGFLDSCVTNDHTKKECCTFSATETFSYTVGDLDVMFSGMVCGKNPKHAVAKGLPFEITGGTGDFAGVSGSGKANFIFDEENLTSKFSFKGTVSE
jgi:hypothetical protein